MRGEAENDFQGDWSESDVEFSPFARQLTITKAKRLIRRHTKKFRSRKGLWTCSLFKNDQSPHHIFFRLFFVVLLQGPRKAIENVMFFLRDVIYLETIKGYLVIL